MTKCYIFETIILFLSQIQRKKVSKGPNVNKWYAKIGDKKEEKLCMLKKITS